MDWTLKIEVSGESSEKILKEAIFDCTDFGKDPNILSPFNSQTKLLKSLLKKIQLLFCPISLCCSHTF